MDQESLRKRIIEICYNHKLSHIGSCLTALPILCEIYAIKKPEEKCILDAGHSHVAHLVVKEALGLLDAEEKLSEFGIHCDRRAGCDVSTGSLGQGLPIATGMALSNRDMDMYCLVSDGGTAEGSFLEALRIAKEQNLTNLKVYLNANGWGAYRAVDTDLLEAQIKAFGFPVEIRRTDPSLGNWAVGLAQHYKPADEELRNFI